MRFLCGVLQSSSRQEGVEVGFGCDCVLHLLSAVFLIKELTTRIVQSSVSVNEYLHGERMLF